MRFSGYVQVIQCRVCRNREKLFGRNGSGRQARCPRELMRKRRKCRKAKRTQSPTWNDFAGVSGKAAASEGASEDLALRAHFVRQSRRQDGHVFAPVPSPPNGCIADGLRRGDLQSSFHLVRDVVRHFAIVPLLAIPIRESANVD